MPRIARLVACAALLWAATAAPAGAESIVPCSSSALSVAQYRPCTADGKFFFDFTASVGGVDVSHSTQLAMTRVPDNFPDDFNWMPLFNYPVRGEFEFDVNAATPLEVGYRVVALPGADPIIAVHMALTNLGLTRFHSLVETFLMFDDGRTGSLRMGWEADGTSLGTRQHLAFLPSRTLTVLTRVSGMGVQGGGGPGFFATSTDPAPVPEPATITLLGTGLAAALARARKRRARYSGN
jgi:hypothetical protein